MKLTLVLEGRVFLTLKTKNIATDLINSLPHDNSENTSGGNNRRERVFSMRFASSKSTDIYR